MKKILLALAIPAILFSSCHNDRFKLKGEIYGGEDKTFLFEKPDFQGRWIVMDSIKTNKNGGFNFSFPAPASPEIYRLSCNGKYIYIPVDKVETITLTTSYDKFGSDFSLMGSPNAEKITQFEKELQALDMTNPDSLTAFKRNVYTNYMKDNRGSILSFYILTKTIGDVPLYSPQDATDRKYFSAVATGFKETAPDDPHTALLEQTALQALKQRNSDKGIYNTVEADEIAILDMNLQDESGNYVKLSDVAGKGKPVVVIFSLMNQPESPELNFQLAQIYRNKNGNVEFYNVSLDDDQYQWREAAGNLPWITVYSPGQGRSEDALKYNVTQLPAYFIYDSNGELSSRPMNLDELNKSL